jgi:hypothetical protein
MTKHDGKIKLSFVAVLAFLLLVSLFFAPTTNQAEACNTIWLYLDGYTGEVLLAEEDSLVDLKTYHNSSRSVEIPDKYYGILFNFSGEEYEISFGGAVYTPLVAMQEFDLREGYLNIYVRKASAVPQTHTVTIDGSGGTLESGEEVQTIIHGQAAAVPIYTKKGYSLSWDKPFENITQDTVIKAVWTPIIYAVTYILDGGTNHAENPENYTISSPNIILKPPTKHGYIFLNFAEGDAIPTGSTGNKTFTALYEKIINQYTYTFYDDDGTTVLKTQTANEDSPIIPPAPPTKTASQQYSYTFSSWDKDIPEKLTQDIVFIAQYEQTQNKYTVAFQDWDGTPISQQEVEYGKAATEPATPEKAGETFIGWDKDFDNITCDILITAQYKKNEYSISYYVYGAIVYQIGGLNYGDTLSELFDAANWLHDGDAFLYWEDATNKPYYLGEEITIDRDFVFTAYTEKKTVYLTLYFQDEETKFSYKYGDTLGLPQQPECAAGYAFDNWYKDIEYTLPFAFGGEIKQDITLYGRQLPIYYDAQFVIVADEDYSFTQKVRHGYSVAKPNIEIEGYDLFWYADEEESIEYDFSKALIKDTQIYCRTEEKTYVVTIQTCDFEGLEAQNVALKYKQSITLPILEYYGYTHTGYLLPEGGAVYEYMPAKDFIIIPTFEVRHFCLTFDGAQQMSGAYLSTVALPNFEAPQFYCFDGWIDECGNLHEDEYQIKSDMNFTPQLTKKRTITVVCMGISQEYLYGDDLTLDIPEKDGHIFLGWYVDEDLTKPFSNKAKTEGEVLNVYPKWTASSFTLFYSSDAGEGQKTVLYGETTTLPQEPSKQGYNFCGWFFDSAYTVPYISRQLQDHCHIYGKFEKKQFLVTFLGKNGRIISQQSVPYLESAAAPELRTCFEEGYCFEGFEGDFSEVTQDLTIVAQYTKVYKIEYKDEQGNTLDGAQPPEKIGYRFVGWQAREDGDTIEYYPIYAPLSTDIDEDIPTDPGEGMQQLPEKQQPSVVGGAPIEPVAQSSSAYDFLHIRKLSPRDIVFIIIILLAMCFAIYVIVRSMKKKPM